MGSSFGYWVDGDIYLVCVFNAGLFDNYYCNNKANNISNWYNVNNKLSKLINKPLFVFDVNEYILIPLFSLCKLMSYSFDVIHSIGFYSLGIKLDAIPGRINIINHVKLLYKGSHIGKCFELCGQGHPGMLELMVVQ